MFALLKNNLIIQCTKDFKVGELVRYHLIDSEKFIRLRCLPIEGIEGASEIVSISEEKDVLEKEIIKKRNEEFNKVHKNNGWVKIF